MMCFVGWMLIHPWNIHLKGNDYIPDENEDILNIKTRGRS